MYRRLLLLMLAASTGNVAQGRIEKPFSAFERHYQAIRTPVLYAYSRNVKLTAVAPEQPIISVTDGFNLRKDCSFRLTRPEFEGYKLANGYLIDPQRKRQIGLWMIIAGSVLLTAGSALIVAGATYKHDDYIVPLFAYVAGLFGMGAGLGLGIPGIVLRHRYK